MSEENAYYQAGIKRISYEEYINLRVNGEIGKDLINE